MNATDTSSPNLERLTVRQLVNLLSKLSVRAVASIIGIILGGAALMFWAGQKYQYNSTAICLERPFGMKITDAPAQDYPYPSLILIPKHGIPSNDGPESVVLTLRQRNAANLFDDIGEVIAQKPPIRSLREMFDAVGNFTPVAYAQPEGFDWGRYRDNNEFRERYVDNNTIRRYYEDGAILEYKVDANGRSIVATLRWIKKPD